MREEERLLVEIRNLNMIIVEKSKSDRSYRMSEAEATDRENLRTLNEKYKDLIGKTLIYG